MSLEASVVDKGIIEQIAYSVLFPDDVQNSARHMRQNMPTNNKEYNYTNFSYIDKKQFGKLKNKEKCEERCYANIFTMNEIIYNG